MNKRLLLLLLSVFCVSVVRTQQQPAPSPTPDPDVVKISTALVQVDVSITDKKGKVITDLRRDEIEIYENGQKQDISNFSFISNARESVVQTDKPTDAKAPNLPPPTVHPEKVRRTIALIVDDLTLSFESTYYVRRALKKFVDEQMQDGDLVAILRTGAGIGALQQFTNDKRQLYAAIERVKWNSFASGKIGAFAPLEAQTDTSADPGGDDEADPGERTVEGVAKENQEFRENVFATGTLGAVNYVVRGMKELPGRKSILLLSDGFRLFEKDADGTITPGRVLDALKILIDQANRASVVVYTMDPRGLQYTGLTAADDTGGRSAEQLQQAESDRRTELTDTQDGLRYLARQTGGFAIVNNNDLSGGIRKILDDQSYYLVGYEPDADTFDAKTRRFNKLVVKVTRPGTIVRYRSGFFGVSDEKSVGEPPTAASGMLNALTSPFAVNDISLKLNALFGNDAKQGAYIRSLMHVAAKDIVFKDIANGDKQAIFDIIAVGYGDNGVPVQQLSKTYTMTIKPDLYKQFLESGFVYDFSFPIKKPGAYQLRVALHDRGSEKFGSANQFVEVPDLKKQRLTLSGVVLRNVSAAEFDRRSSAQGTTAAERSDPLLDTSLRRFKTGTILDYGFSIYNAKVGAGQKVDLSSQIRVFRDGKPIFEGKLQPVQPQGQTDAKAVNFSASLALGKSLLPGDYILEIVIVDNLAKEKHRSVTQYVQFEVAQ